MVQTSSRRMLKYKVWIFSHFCLNWGHWSGRAGNCMVSCSEDSLWANAKCYVQTLPIFLNSTTKRNKDLQEMWTMNSLSSSFFTFFLLTHRAANPCDQVKHTPLVDTSSQQGCVCAQCCGWVENPLMCVVAFIF